MLPEDVADEGHQFAVLSLARGFGFRQPGVVPGPADLERVAGGSQRKGILESELFDDGIRIGYLLLSRIGPQLAAQTIAESNQFA